MTFFSAGQVNASRYLKCLIPLHLHEKKAIWTFLYLSFKTPLTLKHTVFHASQIPYPTFCLSSTSRPVRNTSLQITKPPTWYSFLIQVHKSPARHTNTKTNQTTYSNFLLSSTNQPVRHTDSQTSRTSYPVFLHTSSKTYGRPSKQPSCLIFQQPNPKAELVSVGVVMVPRVPTLPR